MTKVKFTPPCFRAHVGAVSVILLSVLSAPMLVAQSYYGGIRGTVVDQNGGVVPGAKVSLVDEATGAARPSGSSL